jgi:putative transposase
MTVREIQGHLRELYGVEVSPDLISVVTDAVLEQVAEWQNRPLDALYALVFFDALRGEDPRRGDGAEQGRLCRAWCSA